MGQKHGTYGAEILKADLAVSLACDVKMMGERAPGLHVLETL